MCLICVEFQKERMTIPEANRALGEMIVVIGEEHASEVRQMLKDAADKRESQEDDTSD